MRRDNLLIAVLCWFAFGVSLNLPGGGFCGTFALIGGLNAAMAVV